MNSVSSEAGKVTFPQLLRFLKPYRIWVFVTIAVSLLNALADVLVGSLIKEVTDSELKSFRLGSIIMLVIVLTITAAVIKYAVSFTSGYFSTKALRDIQVTTSNHIADLRVSELEKYHSGDFVTRLNGDASVLQGYFRSNLSEFAYRPFVFIGTFVYLFWLNWKLLLAAIILIPITIYGANKVGRPINEFLKKAREGDSRAAAVVVDSIGGIYMEKAFNLTRIISGKYQDAVAHTLHYKLKEQKQLANLHPYNMVIHMIPFVCVTTYGGFLAVQGQLTPGGLFAFIYLLHHLIEPLAGLPWQMAAFREVMVSANRIIGLTHLPVERTDGRQWEQLTTQPAITFDRIAFSYNPESPVLQEVSFTIPHNKTIALVGSSGSGKSTIFKLITGFYTPEQGDIRLYGQNLRDWSLFGARSLISMVSQDPYLFPMTVAENISFGRPDAGMDEIVAAAKAAYAHEFIMSLPDGYQNFVGERGNALSGGQKQRISIARAILKGAPVLLLDEATSALDYQSEAAVQEALRLLMKDRTVLVIAHRLSTIKAADEILVLHKGVIAEKGTHEELLAKNSLYSNLYLKQLLKEEGGLAYVKSVAGK